MLYRAMSLVVQVILESVTGQSPLVGHLVCHMLHGVPHDDVHLPSNILDEITNFDPGR